MEFINNNKQNDIEDDIILNHNMHDNIHDNMHENDNENDNEKKRKIYCSNCGRCGHLYKKCKEPITSIGIIDIQLKMDDSKKVINDFKNVINMIDVRSYNEINLKAFNNIYKYKNKIKFLLIRRKHTLNYIEFLRGRYDVDDIGSLVHLLELMSPDELDFIKSNDFDTLWLDLWQRTSNLKIYEKEYNISKSKFEYLLNLSKGNLEFILDNIDVKFKEPEWGFPKGKRNYLEKNIDCGIREFKEETDFDSKDYFICDKINPINEVFNGTNGILYKHIYYIAIHKNLDDAKINENNQPQIDEIGDIGWFTYEEAIEIIRPYYGEKRKLLDEIYLLIINILIDIENKKV